MRDEAQREEGIEQGYETFEEENPIHTRFTSLLADFGRDASEARTLDQAIKRTKNDG